MNDDNETQWQLMNSTYLLFTFLALMFSCRVSEFYTLKELRTQQVPEALQGKTWILEKIDSNVEPGKTIADNLRNNSDCKFGFEFADKGRLIMTFKEHKILGTYVIEGSRFKYLNSGWREKIIWAKNPECKVTPTELAYVFIGEFQFRIEEETLILRNNIGNSFELVSKN